MSTDLVFDGSFFSDPFSPFADSPIDILQAIPDSRSTIPQNPVEETNSFNQIASLFLSTSPPTHQLQGLSLSQAAQFQNASDSAVPFPDFSAVEVKTEECQLAFRSPHNCQLFQSRSYTGPESAVKMMHRSYSSKSFDGKPGFSFHPCFDGLMEMESQTFQPQVLSSPENGFPTGHIRKVCSAGDLQKMKTTQTNQRLLTSPLGAESSFVEEINQKVGRYSAEERKERIRRYRTKRTQRNFNKTIKYACRKTLADSRPRVRGRFARNDEIGDCAKAASLKPHEDEYELWLDGFNEEDAVGRVGGGGETYFNSSNVPQFHCIGYW